jgi:hypothetical protein
LVHLDISSNNFETLGGLSKAPSLTTFIANVCHWREEEEKQSKEGEERGRAHEGKRRRRARTTEGEGGHESGRA